MMLTLLFAILGLAVLAAPVALYLALTQSSRLSSIESRLSALEMQNRVLLAEIGRFAKPEKDVSSGAAARPVKRAPAAAEQVTDLIETAAAKSPAPVPEQPARAPEPEPVSGPHSSPAQVSPGLEERLGTRWAVWVGGVALALGALLLVRYTIEQGLLGPGFRIVLGAVLAALLVAAGEWLRRTERSVDIELVAPAHIPSILTAAGTVAAFGTIYAAHALYGFLGPGVAFALLAAVGLATLWAASLHGPALAGVGLLGSYVAPWLVSTATPNPWPLLVFLLVVAAAAYRLAETKRWRWLTIAAAAGAGLWGLVFATEAGDDRGWIAAAMLYALAQMALAVWQLARTPAILAAAQEGQADNDGAGILAGFAFVAATVFIANDGVSPAAVVFIALTLALLMWTGLKHVPLSAAVPLAGALTLIVMVAWPSIAGSRFDPTDLAPAQGLLFTEPLNGPAFATLSFLAALVISGLSAQRLIVSPRLAGWSAANYAGAAALLPLLALVVAYLRMTKGEASLLFALAAFAVAGGFALGMSAFESREREEPTPAIRLGTGAMAAAAVAAGALGLMFELERGYLTVALAIGALATAYMADRKDLTILRKTAMAAGLLVLARVVLDPRIMGENLGTTPVFNWLLLGYGVPAVAFYCAARVLERRAEDPPTQVMDALAILFAGLLAFFQIRHFMHGGDVLAATTDHAELGLVLLVSLGFAYALLRSGVLSGRPVFETASYIFGGLAAAVTVAGLLLGANPYLVDDPVKSAGPFDTLWLGYLLPAVAAALLARHTRRLWRRELVLAAAALALVLIFAFVTLEVRHIHQGESIVYWRATSQAEIWSYSLAWLLLGVGLLGYGLWREMPEARLASAAIVLLTVVKVFLWDMSDLEGALRAFSFIGLGAALVGIGLVYQRLIFSGRTTAQ